MKKAIFILPLFALIACLKPKELPLEPVITSADFFPNPDSTGTMIIGFTDGDGDVGLAPGDTFPPYNTSSKFNFNLYLNYYEYQNGAWVRLVNIDEETGDTINPFSYRIPVLETDGKDKTLEGEIEIDMPFIYFNPFSDFDSLRYEIELYDRALNKGVGQTGIILKP